MNLAIFFITLILVFLLTFSGYPLVYLQNSIPTEFLGIFRIAFGTLLLFRIYRSIPALKMFHGRLKPPNSLFIIKAILSFLFLIGAFTDFVAILLFISFISIFFKSKYYSIEELYFQNTLFHIPFLGMGQAWSIDEIVQIPTLIQSEYLMNSFLISNGIIMLSAGYEKFKSHIWQIGKAAKSFLSLPHLIKPNFHFLSKINAPFFWSTITYGIMLGEFLLLFSILNPYTFIIISTFLLCFSISLFIILDISFIGQILFLNLLFFLSIVSVNIDHYPSISYISNINLNSYTLIAFNTNFISLLTIFFFSKQWRVFKISKVLNGITSPISVFNEKHLFGFYTYKLLYKEGTNQTLVLNAFCNQGFPSKYQNFHPRYFQSAMYPITDYCLSLHKYGINTKNRLDEIIDLMYSGLTSIKKTQGCIKLQVKKFDKHDTIESYQETEWVSIIECNFKTENDFRLKFINMPPKLSLSYRTV